MLYGTSDAARDTDRLTRSEGDLFARGVREHDAALKALGLDIWVGGEPTFTDRWSSAPEWTHQAVGEEKARRAEALVLRLIDRFSGGALLRTLGRQYPGENLPRWSLGLYRRRDGQPIWPGPPDPALAQPDGIDENVLERLSEALAARLSRNGARVWRLRPVAAGELRIVVRVGAGPDPDLTDSRLSRPSSYSQAIPQSGLYDELTGEGLWLFLLTSEVFRDRRVARVELPAIHEVPDFLAVLEAVGAAARNSGLTALVLAGFPPPVDASVEWATITPDPAVIEINMAPYGEAAEFLEATRALYAAAEERGLSPHRLYYNGTVADSGGGGQITLGGPAPAESPFLRDTRLLPRLIAYCNRHPSLSYLFAHDSIGPSGQSVRTDERGDDAFRELALTLELLSRDGATPPDLLWRSLAPFMTDPLGNSHRAELNIEKLWNPFLPGRGKLGLVEFRAFRMQHSPERAAALACLLRAVVAMLMQRNSRETLVDFGRELHERYALPFYLEKDLLEILADLDTAGLGLAEPIRTTLLRDEFRQLAEIELRGCHLHVRKALEFWPLVGDASSQDQGTSRLVDSSTCRLELTLRPAAGWEDDFDAWILRTGDVELPLIADRDAQGPVRLFGLKYRSFVPWQGLHPGLGAQVPVTLWLRHAQLNQGCELVFHEWRPTGGPYSTLPTDLQDAAARRKERVVVREVDLSRLPAARPAPPGSLTPWSLDLRWLPPGGANDF